LKESYSIRYKFSQEFDVPARRAFRWCTDYQPGDWGLMGKKGTRKVKPINEDTLILEDTVMGDEGPVKKQRLVRLNPETLSWTNTHIGGPNKHSQFWYKISETGPGRSRLDFTGLQINYGMRQPGGGVSRLAARLRAEDTAQWKLLAKEMEKDLGRSSSRA